MPHFIITIKHIFFSVINNPLETQSSESQLDRDIAALADNVTGETMNPAIRSSGPGVQDQRSRSRRGDSPPRATSKTKSSDNPGQPTRKRKSTGK